MTKRLAKTALIFLLGVLLSLQGMEPLRASPAGKVAAPKAAEHCHLCDSQPCPMRVCCASPAQNSAPLAPLSLPSSVHHEQQALSERTPARVEPVASVTSCYLSPSLPVCSLAAIPLFQRDCCYLL